jgi:hypothetical protein
MESRRLLCPLQRVPTNFLKFLLGVQKHEEANKRRWKKIEIKEMLAHEGVLEKPQKHSTHTAAASSLRS